MHFYDSQQLFGTPMLRTTCGPNKRHSLSHSIDHVFLERVYHVPRNIPDNSFPARLYMFKDNEAVIRMIVKDRRPNVRHVSRTHRIDLECLFERIIVDSSMSIRYVRTTAQYLADNFDEWCVRHPSMEVSDAVVRDSSTSTLNVDRSFCESSCSAVSRNSLLAMSNVHSSQRDFECGPWEEKREDSGMLRCSGSPHVESRR